MEMNIVKKNEKDNKKQRKRSKEQFRVVISKEANDSLEKILKLVNSDFNCGEINKSNVAEWILSNLNGTLEKSDIKKIQELYVDEKRMLQDLLKGSTTDGKDLPMEIRRALKEHYGFGTKTKKVS